jgi:hypothetical protein
MVSIEKVAQEARLVCFTTGTNPLCGGPNEHSRWTKEPHGVIVEQFALLSIREPSLGAIEGHLLRWPEKFVLTCRTLRWSYTGASLFWTSQADQPRGSGLIAQLVAEREGFEPPVPVRAHLISSQAPSTVLGHLSV